jgi:hypothetical protein
MGLPKKKRLTKKKEVVQKRKQINLDQKIDIVRRLTSGQATQAQIKHEYDLAWSTVSTIYANRKKILAAAASAPAPGIRRIVNKSQRPPLADETEKLLLVWVNEKNIRGEGVSTNMIQEKARRIYEELEKIRSLENAEEAAAAATEDSTAAEEAASGQASPSQQLPPFTGE